MSNPTFADYLEFAAILIPQRKAEIKQKLYPACSFIPMPLTLGWESSYTGHVISSETLVPDLCITDIASGATREVKAPWMHALYQQTSDAHPRGATLMHLNEANFTGVFGWQHAIPFLIIALQLVVACYAMALSHTREGWLILAGLAVRILQGLHNAFYRTWMLPRDVKRRRYYALHVRMTTMHVLVIAHEPNDSSHLRYQLEDAAVPLRRRPKNRRDALLERSSKAIIQIFGWAQRVICICTPSNGYFYCSALLFGAASIELLSALTISLPTLSSKSTPYPNPTNLDTDKSAGLLDTLTAVCQATGAVSCQLVETILPDPTGEHVDYKWIKRVVEGGAIGAGLHPNHQAKEQVLNYALRRRTAFQLVRNDSN